jgi:tetratricopeptide (TPR) repeat protein
VKAYREARKLFDSGDHAGALAYFIEAHGHVPGAAPMIKIAECLDALGRTADAIDAYAWFIGSKPSEKFADRVKVAEERLAVLGVAPAEPTAADLERARATFQHALEAFEQGDFATACPGFELAYDLSRSVNALLNVAVCRDKLGERARACTAYARYLKEKGTGGHRDAALDTCPGVPPP